MTVRQTLLALEAELNALSFEREDLVRGLLLALLSRSHLFVLGPPGADKSRLIASLMARIEGASTFSLLLTRFTTPEEVLGPIDIPAYEQGTYARIVTGMLPTAHVAFLDEVFKANSAILNALLELMNERTYRNGGSTRRSPLVSILTASNELPQAEELGPLYDRLLLRYEVGYMADEANVTRLLSRPPTARSAQNGRAHTTRVSLDQIEEAQVEAAGVHLHEDAISVLLRIRSDLRQAGLVVSDRRLFQALGVIRAQAWLSGRSMAVDEDLEVLTHVLWTEPKDRRTVAERVLTHAAPASAKALELRDLAAEQRKIALEKRTTSEQEAAEAMTKLKGLVESLVALRRDLHQRGSVPPRVDRALAEVQGMRREVLRTCLGVEV